MGFTINLSWARWFIGIVVWLGIGIACFLLYKLFGQSVALVGFACLVTSPLFLAQTRRVHTDALTATFILLTVLLFLLYCQNRQTHRYLLFSGAAFGLAVLSKSYALILLLWIPLCLFLFRAKRTGGFWTPLVEGLCFLNCAVLIVFILFPIFWTPLFLSMTLSLLGFTVLLFLKIKKERCPFWIVGIALAGLCLIGLRALQIIWPVFNRINWAITTPHEVEHFFFGKVVNDPGWFFYPFVLTIKSTPLMLPLVIVGCLLLWRQRKHTKETAQHFKTGVALVAGVVLLTVCLSATSKKFSRYLLPVFPMLEILAAIGFVEGFKWSSAALRSRFGTEKVNKYKKALTGIACLTFFFIQIMPVLALHPYYGTYYNLYWKVTDITKIITVGEASGLDIAADYLNNKPDAQRLIVQVSPLATEFVYHYFQGGVYRSDRQTNLSPDYEVVYIRDSQIGRVPQTGTLNGKLEKLITLNGIDHVWIYRVR
ncbi:glycosyltransferase family 39 protein [Candidatus Poribacteria bacterium]|nr:glycosyltransferase family 39 protein [Candidatus Poribacteria bacterium]MYG06040.1 glycosyltransferase family 39 protein [Candidatus Poribacteria bacterium]MYK25245.1 glycosyltransferase family 39 protein [Candidatus Poribacteria bacterium]